MKLFIDDIRMPNDIGLHNSNYLIARNFTEAITYIKEYKPQYITFDHDLGDCSYDGYDIAKFLVDLDLDHGDYITEEFDFNVHSANPVGAVNISKYLNNYLDKKFGNNPKSS